MNCHVKISYSNIHNNIYISFLISKYSLQSRVHIDEPLPSTPGLFVDVFKTICIPYC